MTVTAPIGVGMLTAFAAGLAALLVVAYILKLRRRRIEIPFSKLWQRVLREKETTSLWRRLKRILSLLVQLAFLGLLIFGALDPKLGQARTTGRSVVVIVDASASMKALDEGPLRPSRMDRAKETAKKLLTGLGGADDAMVIMMDGQATALSRFESDALSLVRAVDTITASDTPANLDKALSAAANALRDHKDPLIILIGDGAYPEEAKQRAVFDGEPKDMGDIDLRGIDVRFVAIGQSSRNLGITAFNVRRYRADKLSYEVLVEFQNFGKDAEEVTLTLSSGKSAVDVKSFLLKAGERRREIYPDLGGDSRELSARLTPKNGKDAFAVDDVAFALLPEQQQQHVLVVTADNLYLEAALLDENVLTHMIRPSEYATTPLSTYDVVIFNGFTPQTRPSVPNVVYFNPDRDKSPFKIRGKVINPYITDTNTKHPVMHWVTLGDVHVTESSVFKPQKGDVVLARYTRDPLVIARVRDGKKDIAFGFDLDSTDLTLRVAFPAMIINLMDWFTGADAELLKTYRTGQTWAIPVDPTEKLKDIAVTGPQNNTFTAPVSAGRARFYGRHAGIYNLASEDKEMSLAANLADPFESRIEPAASLKLGGQTLKPPPDFAASLSRSLWLYLALAALALLLVEWFTYNRRITV